MTLDQLRYALELMKTRHFSKAAENCHITQPSLSIQIAKLEDEIGMKLFVRTRAGVEITEHGTEILKQARLILNESERLVQLASELKGEVKGDFRLGVISTLAPSLLPLFIGKFGKAFPHVRLSIIEDRTEVLIKKIDEGGIDAAILSTPAQTPEDLFEKVLFYEPFVLFASKGHPILERKHIEAAQISADDILLLDETHCLRDQVLQLCKSRGATAQSRLRIQSASLQTLIEFIRHNEGYTLLPELSARLLSAGERQNVLRSFSKPLPSRKVGLVFHGARLKRSIIEALTQTIVQALPSEVFPAGSKGLRVLSPSADHFEI